MPSVSVLMPCHNAEATLDEALNSLALQTYEDFEIVVVDDGSSDATADILRYWSKRDSRLRIMHQPHKGIVAALQMGLATCQSPYVARMDADDRTHPDRLRAQVDFLESHPEVSVVSCRVVGFPEEKVRKGFAIYINWLNSLLSDADIRREIFIESPLPHPSVVFKRERVLKVGGYQDLGWAEDYDLWLRLYLSGARFAKLPQVLLEWREHPERLTRTHGRYSLENFLRAKAYYLVKGPLKGKEAVLVWGAGMIGRRLAKQLERHGAPLTAFVDVDPKKIGRSLRGLPIISPDQLQSNLAGYKNPALLAAVGARGARQKIRNSLINMGLIEGEQWWGVA